MEEDGNFPYLKSLLLAMPNVGDDDMFERFREFPHEVDLS
tara:strand:- start:835 stop:954 length:120 start_codon:yes stop_codon:yes gene_type:complete